MANQNITLLETIRESFGRVVYTHKTHEKMAEILETKRAWSTAIEVIATALTASGLISLNFYDEIFIKVTAAFLAFASLAMALYKSFAILDNRISSHQKTAWKLWIIRERYINLISDFFENRISAVDAQKLRDALQNDTHSIYEDAPQTTSCAYSKAQKALKKNEDFTFTENEIDSFLPKTLKNKNNISSR